jgi:hypothetical protein
MHPTTKNLIIKYLKQYKDVLDCEGCNDFEMPLTPVNEEFMELANAWFQEQQGDDMLSVYNGKIVGQDNVVGSYLISQMKDM